MVIQFSFLKHCKTHVFVGIGESEHGTAAHRFVNELRFGPRTADIALVPILVHDLEKTQGF